ncbi:MAG: hypothetical protein ABIV25_15820 [Paracoccaceae bacterium]
MVNSASGLLGTQSVSQDTTITVASGTSAAGLQAVIDAASSGTHIVLAQGTYRFDQTVSITHDGITLEGQGAVTIIADKALNGAPALQVGAELFHETVAAALHITRDAATGGKTLQMANATTVKAGDVIWIERPNDAALFAKIGDTEWQEDKPLRTGLAVVTAVHGNTVSLDRALPFDFDAATTTVEVTKMVHDIVLRNLTFQGDYGTANPADFTNSLAAEKGGMMVSVNTSVGTVIQNVDIVQPGSNGLVLGRSLDAKVDDVTVTGSWNKGDDGNGYAYWLRDIYGCTFTHLQAFDTRHGVLFASYTSAVGNTIQVSDTNRDINFHGGLDHGNTIIVDESVRSTAEQSYLGAPTFYNPGTTYGAPTDSATNVIKFLHVVSTVRADAIVADDHGAQITTLGGNDSVVGGAGNDLIDLGTGDDVVLASAGDDTVIGGAATDRLVLDMNQAQAVVVMLGGEMVVLSVLGRTHISGVEQLEFKTGVVAAAATLTTTVNGSAGVDTISISASAIAGAQVDNVRMIGTDSFVFIGNANANSIDASKYANMLFGEGGDDTIYGRNGNDLIFGGAGDDRLSGGNGADTLDGGAGVDVLRGLGGADVFVGAEGRSMVADFSFGQHDSVRFDGFHTADLIASLSHYLAGNLTAADDFAIAQTVVSGVTTLTLTSDLGDSLTLVGIHALGFRDYLLL